VPQKSICPRALCALIGTGLLWSATACAADDPRLVAPTEALTAQEQQKKFHLPEGFEIQLIAAEPEIRKPINMQFDASGALYVTESVEYPFPAPGEKPARDVIKRFMDTDGDGIPERMSIAVDQLNIPIGLLPLGKKVIAHSIPAIQEFVDTNGDGLADERKVLYSEFGFRDTHGMASSFNYWIDGWVYACHGFANDSKVKGEDGKEVQMNSGNTYRFRPDGSHIEYFTHGQVNPFGMAIDPLGNIFTADCHSRPIYQLLRGAYYPSFGKPHDGLGYGPEMIKHDHGSTGICGLVYYQAAQFPGEYDGTVFIGNPVTGRINHDQLKANGTSFDAVEQPDFLSCDDPWFRPVDIKLAPDGSLYVADFYNRIIGHYEVSLQHPGRDRERGRLWRIVYTGNGSDHVTRPRTMPDLTKVSGEELPAKLADPNHVVRTLATQQLVERHRETAARGNDPGNELKTLKKLLFESKSAEQRVGILWTLDRLHLLEDDGIEELARDPERLVRVHVQKMLAEWGGLLKTNLIQIPREGVSDADPFVRRAAADSLGRHPAPENVPLLMKLWETTDPTDTHLVHVTRMALRDNLRGLEDWSGISDELRSSPRFLEICLGLADARGAEAVLKGLQARPQQERRPELWYHAARHGNDQTIQETVELFTGDPLEERANRFFSIRALARGLKEKGKPIPESVKSMGLDLVKLQLPEKNPVSWQGAAEIGMELGVTEAVPAFEEEWSKATLRDEGWSWLAEALINLDSQKAVGTLGSKFTDAKGPPGQRKKLAELLGRVNRPEARKLLGDELAVAPQEIALPIARSLAGNKVGVELLLGQIGAGKSSASLLQDTVVQERVKSSGLPMIEERLGTLLKDLPAVDQRILDLIAARREAHGAGKWDPRKGEEVFAKNCAGCHRIGGKGAKVGPELDGIGLRGLDRLLEDTLNPNGNVDQAFRATVFALTDGRVLNGLLLRQEGEVYVIADEKGQEQRIAVGDVEEKKTQMLSPMPADVAEKLPEQDFQNLMEFLLRSSRKPDAAAQ
jgi:putative heme-binding domain-containing protein